MTPLSDMQKAGRMVKKLQKHLSDIYQKYTLYTDIYMYMYMYIYIHTHIYIYREREISNIMIYHRKIL